ncbi:hypothetical protein MYSTI_05312 [Myxococcus stipitatus DSM 14675]|uniref:Uncharacterized protein n=1 Tax=Myxococcus stipitatus (strain DSM 14675 / JCM 12634 / Mx s8) TaxID=1278073 RepID=L7UG84_MYXSD|nr:hypothetical protein [Myxococcus stipitatus]AGC46592.1 hypothetical protein MYSTI_05312 [Myxococcus stipitatus DSM 14675]
MNNALTKIATAQPSTSGRYPRFGNYLLEVAVIRVKEGFKGDSQAKWSRISIPTN